MPMTRLVFRGTDYLHPVFTTDFLGGICPDVNHAHLVVPAKPVVVHDPYLEADVADVEAGHVKLERLVVDRDECVFLDFSFPLVHSFALVDHVYLHIRVCNECSKMAKTIEVSTYKNRICILVSYVHA